MLNFHVNETHKKTKEKTPEMTISDLFSPLDHSLKRKRRHRHSAEGIRDRRTHIALFGHKPIPLTSIKSCIRPLPPIARN